MIIVHDADDMHSGIQLKGDVFSLLDEFTGIVRAMRNMLRDHLDEESADEVVALCGKLAFSEDAGERELIVDRIREIEESRMAVMDRG